MAISHATIQAKSEEKEEGWKEGEVLGLLAVLEADEPLELDNIVSPPRARRKVQPRRLHTQTLIWRLKF